jgi:hypothetical protein
MPITAACVLCLPKFLGRINIGKSKIETFAQRMNLNTEDLLIALPVKNGFSFFDIRKILDAGRIILTRSFKFWTKVVRRKVA